MTDERKKLLDEIYDRMEDIINLPDNDFIFISDVLKYAQIKKMSFYFQAKAIRLFEKRFHPIDYQKLKCVKFIYDSITQ